MSKVIFLDRDGVINRERGDYTWRISDFEFNDGLFEFMQIMQKRGYLFIVITNQGGIARKVYTNKEFLELTDYMLSEFKKEDITVTDLYYCPHHSNVEKCLCRKPEPLMLEKAIAKYNVDIDNSYFIGDSERDIIAGNKVGLNTIKIEANTSLLDIIKDIN